MKSISGARTTQHVAASLCLAILIATWAEAAVIATVTLVKDPSAALPFTAPDAALGAPWISYRLSLTADCGDTIQAVEASISGQLHQRWHDTEENANYQPTGNSTNQANGDSHFMAIRTGANPMFFATGPMEDNSFAGSPLSPSNNGNTGWGVGTSMSATFGPAGAAVTQMNVAYIVIPSGSEPNLDIRLKVYDPTGNILTSMGNCEFTFASCGVVVDDVGPIVGDMNLNPPRSPTNVSATLPWTSRDPVVWAFDGNPAGPGAPHLTPTLNSMTGLFTWDVDGSKGGLYTFRLKASTVGTFSQSGSGLLTVLVIVPEPATNLLFGLALAGIACVFRKRSATIN